MLTSLRLYRYIANFLLKLFHIGRGDLTALISQSLFHSTIKHLTLDGLS